MKTLPLYPGSQPCVNSGLCCKKGPCAFGTWDEESHQCVHLEPAEDGRYLCGIAEWIVEQPGWEYDPSFGSGCCMSLFNDNRDRILRKMALDKSDEHLQSP